MSIANRLHDRPDLDQQFGALALYVTGTLPAAKVQLEYSARLQIHNAIGACWVEVLDGVIPPGGHVFVDNATSEVVVAWPAYSETPSPPDNAGFETGDLTGWTYSTIGGSGAPVVTNSQHNSGSYAAYWAGGKGLGSEGGIECVLLNNKACVAYPGQRINFKATILYNPGGGTPKGSRGQVRLNWYNADGDLIDTSYGELIKTRSHNGIWTDSAGSAKGPPGTKSARLAVWLTATGAGHSYCDDATWDAPAVIGTKDEGQINLWLRVHDAGGRVADWRGVLQIISPPPINVRSLLRFAGANGSTTVLDDIPANSWACSSGTNISAAKPLFSATTLHCNGSSYGCVMSSLVGPGTGDFTVEAFVDFENVSSNGNQSWLNLRGVGIGYSVFLFKAAMNIYVTDFNGTNLLNSGGTVVAQGTYTHIALVRKAGILSLFVGGHKTSSVTHTQNISTMTPWLGSADYSGVTRYLDGYIGQFRVCYSAVYDDDFTPPEGPLPAV